MRVHSGAFDIRKNRLGAHRHRGGTSRRLLYHLVLFKISRVPCGVNHQHANSFTNPDKRVTFDTFVENQRSIPVSGAQNAQIRLALAHEGGSVKIVVAQRLLHDHAVGCEQDQLREIVGGDGVGALGDFLGDEPLEGSIAVDELGAQRLVAEHGGVDQVQAHAGGGGVALDDVLHQPVHGRVLVLVARPGDQLVPLAVEIAVGEVEKDIRFIFIIVIERPLGHAGRRGNAMYDQICKELNVPFSRVGQYVCFQHGWLRPAVWGYCMWRKYHDGIADTELISGKELLRREPNFNPKTRFAISNPDSGCVCPYGLTIAYAENAVQNGARIALNTAVLGMDVADGRITAVHTNRGTLHPALVINAAGVFAEDVARMADDRFFSIHPRRGTNSILDRKAGAFMHSIASVKGSDMVSKTHSKGGGILHTVHDNLLIGPDAVETYEKENTATYPESIAHVFEKQKVTMPALTERDIITYFTGVRAPTFEEDFIIERGRHTHNLIHVAGIQSPGLTTAPAVAVDVADMAVRILARERPVAINPDFDPHRPGIPVLREMDDATRAEYIAKNPDYGVIVCRCEEISRGEILDALRSNVCVPTVDGVKKRVRPGMGRCQGGFCSPQVVRIIAEYLGVPLSAVRKSSADAPITFGPTKSGEVQA